MLLQERVGLDGRVTCEGADRDVRARVPDVRQIGEPADVDELRRPRDAELERRNERVPARERLRVGIGAEQADGVLDRLGHFVVERCGNHCFASSIARQTRSGVAGIWMSVTPRCERASMIPLITAGAAAIVPVSPTPFAPNGWSVA